MVVVVFAEYNQLVAGGQLEEIPNIDLFPRIISIIIHILK